RGVRVDVDHRDVRPAGIGEVGRVVDDLGVESALHALGHRLAAVGVGGDVLDHRALLGVALDVPAALLPGQVLGPGLEHRGGDHPCLVAHLARYDGYGGARDGGAA